MQKTNLEILVARYGGNRTRNTEIISLPIEAAVEKAIEFGEQRNVFNYPNIWILDPYKATHLPWDVVKRIGNLKKTYHYKGKDQVRKPELIINLMTHDLQRNIDTNPNVIEIALGMSESEWRPIIEEYRNAGLNTREAIINIYASRLSELYEKPPIITEIKITNDSAIVYCLLLCTDSNAGHYVYKLKGIPEYNNWVINEWKKDAEKITIEKKTPKEQKRLGEFF